MTKTIIATAAILFAATAYAADSRQQFISDNPDSDNSRGFYLGMTAVAPGVGADLDRYQGIADDNPDLFAADLGTSPSHASLDIYGPLGASPDVTY